MGNEQKRSSAFQRYLGNAFFFFILLATFNVFAAGATTSKARYRKTHPTLEATPGKKQEIYVQQIAPQEENLKKVDVYSHAPTDKSLTTSTRFKVIDDFNSGALRNKQGSLWQSKKEKSKNVDLILSKEDARGVHPGYSLKIRVDLQKQEQFELTSSLEKLNMMKADFLALKCRTQGLVKKQFNGRVRISLSDWAEKTVVRDITDACSEKEGWNDVILPMSFFQGVDLRQLDHVEILILARNKHVEGEVDLDEITFFGPEEVGFESVAACFQGFPREVLNSKRREELLKTSSDKDFLLKIAMDTWRYFENGVDLEHYLVADHLKIGDFPLVATYTSPTNIAMSLMAAVAARELGVISGRHAAERVQSVLKSLQEMKRWKGFFYNYYELMQLSVSRPFVSSVDNGWLAISLVVVRQAFPGKIAEQATAILNGFNFQEFLDPENNHLAIGYDVAREVMTPYHYGLLVTEARAMSLYAIGKGDLPREHWWFLYRTAPAAWNWQNQVPKGEMVIQDGVNYFQGYYTYGEKKFVPSWGGSLFEFLMPTMVIDEKRLAPKSLGLNDKIVTEIHRDYALREKKYPVWGISPSAIANGRQWQYGEYGVKKLGVKGYPDKGVITPHVSFLALETLPQDAIKNIRKLLQYEIYGDYGFYDSIMFPDGKINYEKVNHQYLALDQGMILIPIANYLKNGVIQAYFHKDPIGQKIEELLKKEDFFNK